jgi:hypothetical protein
MLMLTIGVGLMAMVVIGTVAGGLAGWLTARFLSRGRMTDRVVDLDLVDEQIDHAAAQWAEAHHAPAAAPLVADKLRLAYVLQQQQGRGRKRRWSR